MTEPDDDEIEKLAVELRERMSDVEPLPHEDFFTSDTLHRFLKARDWKVEDAERQLRETVGWRRQMDPVHVDCRCCHEQPGCHCIRQVGFDKQGRPVMYVCFGQSSCQDTAIDESIVHMTQLFENAKRTMPDGVSMWVFVVDCTGMTLSACNPRVGYGICNAMATFYPERLGVVVCIHHNPVFHGVWNAFKVFLDANTAAKMQMVRKKTKFRDVFYRLFDDELATWLMDEVKLNKWRPTLASQRQFWKGPDLDLTPVEASSPSPSKKERILALARSHDPRGCALYVQQYIDPYLDKCTNGELSHSSLHHPHPNIVDDLRGAIASCSVSQSVTASASDIVIANGNGSRHSSSSDAAVTAALNSDVDDDELQSPISVSGIDEQFQIPKHVCEQYQIKQQQQTQ